eukprot:6196495-Pleurochrysis_carterae.AAC.2
MVFKSRKSARGGARIGAGRSGTSGGTSGGAEASANASSHEESVDPNMSSHTRAQARSTGVAPEAPDLSPVSATRASQSLPPERMTKAQLLWAYNRLAAKRRCAERKVRHLRKGSSASNAPPPKTRGMRKTVARDGSSCEKVVADRRRRLAHTLQRMLDLRPIEDHAHAIDYLIQGLSVAQRQTLRDLPSVQQERFLASRDLCATLRAKHFTPSAALTVRLENFLSTRAMDRASTALSKCQRDDCNYSPYSSNRLQSFESRHRHTPPLAHVQRLHLQQGHLRSSRPAHQALWRAFDWRRGLQLGGVGCKEDGELIARCRRFFLSLEAAQSRQPFLCPA